MKTERLGAPFNIASLVMRRANALPRHKHWDKYKEPPAHPPVDTATIPGFLRWLQVGNSPEAFAYAAYEDVDHDLRMGLPPGCPVLSSYDGVVINLDRNLVIANAFGRESEDTNRRLLAMETDEEVHAYVAEITSRPWLPEMLVTVYERVVPDPQVQVGMPVKRGERIGQVYSAQERRRPCDYTFLIGFGITEGEFNASGGFAGRVFPQTFVDPLPILFGTNLPSYTRYEHPRLFRSDAPGPLVIPPVWEER